MSHLQIDIGPKKPYVSAMKTERTRSKLIQALRDEVRFSGEFSVEAVTKRAGMSVPTFYNYFANREDALIAACRAFMEEVVAVTKEKTSISKLLQRGLEQTIEDWISIVSGFFRTNAAFALLLQAKLAQSEELVKIYKIHETQVIDLYREFVELGQAAGKVRTGSAPEIAEFLNITIQSWRHPLVIKSEPGSELHAEMTRSMALMLRPQ
ncbi:MAG: TetR/AcrR family transcriptional regulator [Pseudomonadota bacterium]